MQVITHPKHATNVGKAERIASIIGGSALALAGLRKRTPGGIALAALGAAVIERGATGHCRMYEALGIDTAEKGQGAETTSLPYPVGIRVDRAITVARPRHEVYRFWRDLQNLPRFMKHLESVQVLDERRSHWVVSAPAGRKVEWDAVIHNEIENELLAWRSLENADVDNAGSVRFSDAPGGRGTEVRVELQYNPPAGIIGAVFAKLFGEEPTQQIEEDLRRFKQIMEAGEIPTTAGQPSGRDVKDEGTSRRTNPHEDDVQYASELSFPASDSPSWRG